MLLRQKGLLSVVLDGWPWNEIKALPPAWFSGLAVLLGMVESTVVWPQGLLDAHVAMIPKTDGDPTPSSQRPSCVLPVVGCGPLKGCLI